MKLSISTLGCPDWDFMQVVRKYAALGADIEVRGIDGETEAGKIARFAPENAEETRRILKEHNLKIVGFGTSCKFDREEKLEENIAAAKEAVDVCVRMGIPAVRVFGNDVPEPSRTLETALLLCRGLEEVCAYGAEKGVKVNLNCTPFVRQYDILSKKWGVLLCQKEYQTNDIRRSSREWL